MEKVSVINWSNEEVQKIDLNPEIFSQPIREDILHRVVNWQLSKARSGCHKSKQRNEVSGSTRKIYKQKGTGGARHGSIKAPIFVGGGVVFGPVVRSHEYKLNKKLRKLGLKVALSARQQEGVIKFLDKATLNSYKTADFKQMIDKANLQKVLIIDGEFDQNLINASSNMHCVDLLLVDGLNVLSLLKAKNILITLRGLQAINERLS